MSGQFSVDKPLRLSVYFSGTGFPVNATWHLAGKLYQLDSAPVDPSKKSDSLKMGFNGCGVDYGFRGVVFGHGLEKQCSEVISVIDEYYKQGGQKIILNCYGHSRGGIAALMLAKALKNVPSEKLSVNLLLVDPVPGNLVATSTLDVFGISLANQVMDLTDCRTLSSVLCLYPYEKLPDLSFHAPLFPDYPAHCRISEEVIPGRHAGAERLPLTYYRSRMFLDDLGVQFNSQLDREDLRQKMSAAYDHWSARVGAGKRYGHGNRNIFLVSDPDPQKRYVNTHHQMLLGLSPDDAQCKLRMERPKPVVEFLKSALKWLVIGAGIVSILYFTGGLALIPYVAGITAKLGGFIIPALAPVLAPVLLGAWAYVGYPLIKRLIHPCFTLSEYRYSGSPEAPSSGIQGSGSYGQIIGHGIIPGRRLVVEAPGKKVDQSPVQDNKSLGTPEYAVSFSPSRN